VDDGQHEVWFFPAQLGLYVHGGFGLYLQTGRVRSCQFRRPGKEILEAENIPQTKPAIIVEKNPPPHTFSSSPDYKALRQYLQLRRLRRVPTHLAASVDKGLRLRNKCLLLVLSSVSRIPS